MKLKDLIKKAIEEEMGLTHGAGNSQNEIVFGMAAGAHGRRFVVP